MASLRWALLALGVVWAVAALRARPAAVLAVGLTWATLGSGFWVLALGRPYGLFLDPVTTGRAAQISVQAAAPALGSFVAGEASRLAPVWTGLLALGVPARGLILLPSWLPVVAVPLVALVIGLAWGRRDLALLAACFWLAFHTGALEPLRAGGYLPGQWSDPEAALGWPLVVLLMLLSARVPLGRPARAAVPLLVLGGLVALGLLKGAPVERAPLERLWLITLDQGAWFWLALPTLLRASDAASLSLVAGGALLALAPGAAPLAPWAAPSLCRLGYLLAGAESLEWLGHRIPHGLWARLPLGREAPPAARGGLALALLVLLPGSFGTWWDPLNTDRVYDASTDPVPEACLGALGWIRAQTPAAASFVASPENAPLVAVLGGRRVLRAPSLGAGADEGRRERAEQLVMRGKPLPAWTRSLGPLFVLAGPGDFHQYGVDGPEDLEPRPGFALRYADRYRYRVYEVVPP